MTAEYVELDVYCDGKGCKKIAGLSFDFWSDTVYLNEDAIEKALKEYWQSPWLADNGRHFCSEACKNNPAPEEPQ